MSPTHIKAECKREEPGTSGLDEVLGSVWHGGNAAQLPLGKASVSGVRRAGPMYAQGQVFSCGIRPALSRLLRDLLWLRLPHSTLRQQMLTEYLVLAKVCAKPPKYGL